uniref:Uncharacterized protein n=1 Tax=Plectus sambesii TaxID=2011161 RepID=A0A914VFE5_9BILA
DVCAQTQDTHNACALLEAGAEFCATTNVAYTEALFRLCKGVLIVLDPQRRDELREILERVQSLISVVPGSQSRREELKSFFLVLQVCYFLSTG